MALLSPAYSRADDWQRADVYLIDWDVLTRASLTPEQVRKSAQYKHTFSNDASMVWQLLDLRKLKRIRPGKAQDVRLVVDLIDDTQQRSSYYASRFSVWSEDGRSKYAIDEPWRQRFTRLLKHYNVR